MDFHFSLSCELETSPTWSEIVRMYSDFLFTENAQFYDNSASSKDCINYSANSPDASRHLLNVIKISLLFNVTACVRIYELKNQFPLSAVEVKVRHYFMVI